MIQRRETGFINTATGEPFVPVGVNYSGAQNIVDYKGAARRCVPLFGVDRFTEDCGLDEARKWLDRLAALNMNIVRLWIEPQDSFPYASTVMDAKFADDFDTFLDLCGRHGVYATVGMHMTGLPSRWVLHNFQPPHNEVLLDHLREYARRWGEREEIFSWTIVGEGQLPWYTRWLGEQWPHWLQYWYNDSLDDLKGAWQGETGVDLNSFADAPVPPRNIGPCRGVDSVIYSRLNELPHDPWAGSTWRYDWRMFLEETGARRVHREVSTMRAAGAKQMFTVGANCWTFPNLPAGQMTMGYNPYFYLGSVDYLCQHHYPMPQCLPGAMGDPLDSDEAMEEWLTAIEIMGRIYTSMGKPVILEEWGWCGGGGDEFAGTEIKYRSEEEQAKLCGLTMERSQHFYAGWIYWMHRDMPYDGDLTSCCGLHYADGRIKQWGKRYAEWAGKLQAEPPTVAPTKETVELPMKQLMTDDRFHETWWHDMIAGYAERGPLDFTPVFERKPMVDWPNDVRDLNIVDRSVNAWAGTGGA